MELQEKRSPLVAGLVVIMLLALSLFLGGVTRWLTLYGGRSPRFANSVGALSSIGLFAVFLIAFVLWEVTST